MSSTPSLMDAILLQQALNSLEKYEKSRRRTDPRRVEKDLREAIFLLQKKLWMAEEKTKKYEENAIGLMRTMTELENKNVELRGELMEVTRRMESKKIGVWKTMKKMFGIRKAKK
ncbi:hypothetical protein L596_009023 [Steinernema carpocapsae]|uniref:Uncharacterized protein n=1 Tax=Steinernema carpocapsae TaxID=34508 RepID=A0A4U5PEF2_STECR|nr:hypothetical protein L596_009023 [Steinernema carpocapsae]